jgi:hypothetical protein
MPGGAGRLPGRGRHIAGQELLDCLGEPHYPPPDVRVMFDRAGFADRLPELAVLSQRDVYDLCCRVAAHLTGQKVSDDD